MSWLCGILGRSTPLVREAGSAVCAGKTGQPGVRSLFPMSKVHVTVSATPGLWGRVEAGGGEPSLPPQAPRCTVSPGHLPSVLTRPGCRQPEPREAQAADGSLLWLLV